MHELCQTCGAERCDLTHRLFECLHWAKLRPWHSSDLNRATHAHLNKLAQLRFKNNAPDAGTGTTSSKGNLTDTWYYKLINSAIQHYIEEHFHISGTTCSRKRAPEGATHNQVD
eukprot:3034086-Amphidinium_carterae.2